VIKQFDDEFKMQLQNWRSGSSSRAPAAQVQALSLNSSTTRGEKKWLQSNEHDFFAVVGLEIETMAFCKLTC
jgi:hypothetical protein